MDCNVWLWAGWTPCSQFSWSFWRCYKESWLSLDSQFWDYITAGQSPKDKHWDYLTLYWEAQVSVSDDQCHMPNKWNCLIFVWGKPWLHITTAISCLNMTKDDVFLNQIQRGSGLKSHWQQNWNLKIKWPTVKWEFLGSHIWIYISSTKFPQHNTALLTYSNYAFFFFTGVSI